MSCKPQIAAMPQTALLVAFLVMASVITPVGATTNSSLTSWPIQIRHQMARLAEAEWRIRLAAGSTCPSITTGTGISLDYIGAYDPRTWDDLRRELNMSSLPQVAAVASGSPADIAGVKSGDELVAIGDMSINDIYAASTDRTILADDIADILARQPSGAPIALTLQRDGSLLRRKVRPIPICGSRVILTSSRSIDAYSDDSNIAVTTSMVGFTANDDELALIVGHELAHVILQHDGASGLRERRRMEDEADLGGATLTACAGYDVRKGALFWDRFHQQDKLSWARLPTHRSSREREKRIREAAGSISCPFSPQALAPAAPK